MKLYIGGYTQKNNSPGIHRVEMDEEGALRLAGTTPHGENPSFLIASPLSDLLYAVSELDGSAAVWAYRIAADGSLTLAKRVGVEGSGLCYLSVAGGSNHAAPTRAAQTYGGAPAFGAATRGTPSLLGACYLSGSVFRVELDGDGLPTERISYFTHPRGEPAVVTHAHCLVPDPQGRFAVAADLGLDCLFVYPLDRPGLAPLEDATVRLPKGEGPRHLVFHPSLPMAYLSTEYGNRVYAFRYDSDRGRLDAVQALSALPSDENATSYCADIRLSADGNILLVSNRGHDSIACFRVDADGSLAALGRQSTFGSWPRGFALLGDDRFLVVADQKDDLLVSVRFDPEHPQAHPISRLAIPAPTWVSAM